MTPPPGAPDALKAAAWDRLTAAQAESERKAQKVEAAIRRAEAAVAAAIAVSIAGGIR